MRYPPVAGVRTICCHCEAHCGAIVELDGAGRGYRLMHRFGSPNAGGTGLMCGGPQFAAGALTFGFASAFPDVAPGTTRAIVVWGRHPAASAPNDWRRILQAVRAGARLVVVDPRPTLEARRADVWLAPRPGTDAALALAVLHVILDERRHAAEFVQRWTSGFDELSARAAEWPPDRAAAVCGVEPDAIAAVARAYGCGGPAVLMGGTPNGQGRNALDFERALQILIAITGNLDRPGGSRLFGPTPSVGSEVTWDDYSALPPEQRRKRLGSDRFRLHHEGVELLSPSVSRVWHGIPYPVPRRVLGIAHPPSIFRAIRTGEPYPVRALLLQHHNAVGAYPSAAAVISALRASSLELVVAHELTLTATAALADYVLPAASWLEKPFMLSHGWGTPVLTGGQVVAPAAERRSDYDVCRDLGLRLGQTWPDTVSDVYDEWLRDRGLSFAELNAADEWWIPPPSERGRHEAPDPLRDWTLVETPAGSVRQRARLVPGLGVDRVNAERWWYPEGPDSHPALFGVTTSNVNAVTDDDLDLCDPAYGALPYRVASCRIARAPDLEGPA